MYLDTFCFVMHCDIKDTKKWAVFEAFLLVVTFPQDTFGPVHGGSVVYGVYLQY